MWGLSMSMLHLQATHTLTDPHAWLAPPAAHGLVSDPLKGQNKMQGSMQHQCHVLSCACGVI